MNPDKAYKFCPKCGRDLAYKGGNVLVCSGCGFHLYINPFPCNAAIIENEKGEIMLVKRKEDPKKGFWDLPGGFINPNESFEDSVKREIKEELGLDIEIKNIVGAYEDTYVFQNIANPTFCVVASAKITGGKIKVSDDINGYKYFLKRDVLKQKLAFRSINTAISDYLKKP